MYLHVFWEVLELFPARPEHQDPYASHSNTAVYLFYLKSI